MQNTKERAAAGQRAALAREQEFMSLAPGVGILPEEYRNQGFNKLDYGPGEGGISGLLESQTKKADEAGGGIRELLSALAAGADPQEYAKQLLGEQTTGRARRGRQPSTTQEA